MDYATESYREEFEDSRLKTVLTTETSRMSIYVHGSHVIFMFMWTYFSPYTKVTMTGRKTHDTRLTNFSR